MTLRFCLGCGRVTTTHRDGRCPTCAQARDRQRNQRGYNTATYRRRQRAWITAWIRDHGLACPGDSTHPPHLVKHRRDLTINHVRPICPGVDPLDETNWEVICRSSNSRRRSHPTSKRGGIT